MPGDVSPTLVHELAQPVEKRRGWVAVPTYDMREYVKSQVFTAIAGFVVGVGLGAVFGNFLAGKQIGGAVGKVIRNPKRSSRRSSRKKKTSPRIQAILDRIPTKDRRDLARLAKSIQRELRSSAGHISWDAEEASILTPIPGRRALSLGKRYASELAEILRAHVEYFPSGYTASGSGAFGHYGTARGHYYRAELVVERRKKPRRNSRRTSPRRTSTRRRPRGRPTARAVTEELQVKLPDGVWRVSVDRGQVLARGRSYGSVYDLGTTFRAIPYGGPVRSYGTLAGAVKHVIRRSEPA